MPHTSPVRLGIIGAGIIGTAHADAALAVSDMTVTAVADINTDSAQHLAARHNAASFVRHEELVDSGLVDAVIVATPHALHTESVLAAATAGIHVLVEKPMAISVADCDAMIAAANAAGVCLAVGHHQHYMPHISAARTVLANGEIGRPLAILDNRTAPYRRETRPAWFFSPELAGGGVLFNIGAHCIDRVLWLSGQNVSNVSATLLYRSGFDVDSDALVQLTFDGGATAQITITGDGTPARDDITVIGDAGVLTISGTDGVHLRRGTASTHICQPSDQHTLPLVLQLDMFAAAIRGNKPPHVSGEHGRAVVAAIRSAYDNGAKIDAVEHKSGDIDSTIDKPVLEASRLRGTG